MLSFPVCLALIQTEPKVKESAGQIFSRTENMCCVVSCSPMFLITLCSRFVAVLSFFSTFLWVYSLVLSGWTGVAVAVGSVLYPFVISSQPSSKGLSLDSGCISRRQSIIHSRRTHPLLHLVIRRCCALRLKERSVCSANVSRCSATPVSINLYLAA